MTGQNSNTQKEFNIKSVKPRYINITEDIFLNLTPESLKLYMALRFEADYAQECSSVKKNIQFLINKTKISRRQVFYCLKELETCGLIYRESEKGFQSIYWVAQDYGHFIKELEPVHEVHRVVHDMHGVVHEVHDIITNTSTNVSTKESITYSNTKESEINSVDNFNILENNHGESLIKNDSGSKKKYSEEFLEFWECTNKKGSKWNACKAWRSLKLDKRLDELKELWNIFYKNDFKNRGHNFIPNISTWLNSHPWDNEKLSPETSIENASKTQNKAHISDFSSNGVHQDHSRQFKSPEQVEEELKKRNEESVARAQKQAEEFLKQKGIDISQTKGFPTKPILKIINR